MKRKWLPAALAALIVAGAGSYYIPAAAKSSPEFVLQKESGDEKAADSIVLNGDYGLRETRQTVVIDTTGSKYLSRQSLLEGVLGQRNRGELTSLIERHRSFMRGKNNISSFYEDAELLTYVEIKDKNRDRQGTADYFFHVSVLDKKQKKTVSYEVEVPNGRQYRYIYVQDVQVVDNQLKVLAIYDLSGEKYELHLHTLSLERAEPASDQILPFGQSTDPAVSSRLRGVSANPLAVSRYSAVNVTESKRVRSEEGVNRTEDTGSRMLIYDLKTGQEVKLLSNEAAALLSGGNRLLAIELQGDVLHAAVRVDEDVKVIRYLLSDGKMSEHTLSLPPINSIAVKNGLAYMLLSEGDESKGFQNTVIIVDSETGQTVYQGRIGLKDPNRYPADLASQLYLHSMYVK